MLSRPTEFTVVSPVHRWEKCSLLLLQTVYALLNSSAQIVVMRLML